MSTFDDQVNVELDFAGLRQSSIHGAVATAGGQGIKFAVSFISQIWLARLINPAEYGLVAMVAPILGFIGIIGDMGIGTALVQQKSISQSQISALFWLNAALSFAACSVLVAISPMVGMLYHEPKTVSITIALAALFFVSSLGIHPAAILNRQMKLVRRAVIDSVQAVVALIVGILTARAGCSYWSLVYMQVAGTVTGLILTWWSAGWLPARPRWDPSAMRILRFGTSLTVSNIAMYMSASADNMIVGAVNGKVALGLYDKAYRLVMVPLVQLSNPIGRVAVPLLSRLNGEPERYASAFKRMVQLPTLLFTPGLICGMFLAPELVQVFLGPTWSGISRVFSWVCLGGISASLYGSASWLYTSQGRGRGLMKWSVITSLISIASFVIGIRWGAVGVASCAAVGFVFIQTPLIIWAATKTGPVTASYVSRAMAPMAAAFVVTSPVVYLYSEIVHMNAIGKLCGGVALTFVVYPLILCAIPSGREMLSGSFALISTYLRAMRPNPQREPA